MTGQSQDERGSEQIEFISPLEVSRCAERLDGRHERRKFWAWDWQTRLTVHITPVDESTYRFIMRKVDKNSLLAWGSLVEVRGTLRALGPTQTVVTAQTHWSWLWAVLNLALFTWMGMAMGFIFNGQRPLDDRALVVAALFGVIGLLCGVLFTWWWGERHLRGMLGTLKDAAGYLG